MGTSTPNSQVPFPAAPLPLKFSNQNLFRPPVRFDSSVSLGDSTVMQRSSSWQMGSAEPPASSTTGTPAAWAICRPGGQVGCNQL